MEWWETETGSPGVDPPRSDEVTPPKGVPTTTPVARSLPDSSATTDPPVAPARPRRSKGVRRILWGSALLAVVGWTIGAVAFGVSQGSSRVPEAVRPPADIDVEIQQISIPDAPERVDDGPNTEMINVLGLTPTEAQSAISDVGLDRPVTVTDVPTAGRAGFVIDQQPGAGSEVGDDIVLSVSASVDVPTVVGADRDDAVLQLEALGAEVGITQVYDPAIPAGQVISIEPAVGPLPAEVEILVGAPASELDLTVVEPLQSDCQRPEPTSLDGIDYPTGIQCRIDNADERIVAWDLSRDVDTVSVVVGMDDVSDIASFAQVSVRVDGAVLQSETVRFGSAFSFEIDVAGALRFEILIVAPEREVRNEWIRSHVAIAEVVATGGRAAIDRLAGIDS